MSIRARLDRLDRLTRAAQAAAPVDRGEGRRELARMIEDAQAAAEAADQVAVYRLSGIASALAKAERARQAPDAQLAEHLEALAAAYHDAADLPDKAQRDAWREVPA